MQGPDCFGEYLIYFNCFDFYRPRVIIQIKRQILGQARRLERGQQMTVQILVAEIYTYYAVILSGTLHYHTLSIENGGAAYAANEEPLSVQCTNLSFKKIKKDLIPMGMKLTLS